MPDLSRYAQYQPQRYTQSEVDTFTSNMAAANAIRTHSMNSRSFDPNRSSAQPRQNPGRTMSLSSYRSHSLSSLNGAAKPRSVMSSQSGRPEKIVVKRTETKDQYGRTTSITTETIRTLGGFDLVKKETKNLHKPPGPAFHSGASYQGSSLDNDLGSILEEDETEAWRRTLKRAPAPGMNDESRVLRPVKSISTNGGKRASQKEKKVIVVRDDEEASEGGSVYSDAFDILPSERLKPRLARIDNLKVSQAKKPQTAAGPQKQMSREEMYDMAYKVALAKVYGTNTPSSETRRTDGFKSYSLRGDNPLRKNGNSPRLNQSRSNSITSFTQRLSSKPKGDINRDIQRENPATHVFADFETMPTDVVEQDPIYSQPANVNTPAITASVLPEAKVQISTATSPVVATKKQKKKFSDRFSVLGKTYGYSYNFSSKNGSPKGSKEQDPDDLMPTEGDEAYVQNTEPPQSVVPDQEEKQEFAKKHQRKFSDRLSGLAKGLSGKSNSDSKDTPEQQSHPSHDTQEQYSQVEESSTPYPLVFKRTLRDTNKGAEVSTALNYNYQLEHKFGIPPYSAEQQATDGKEVTLDNDVTHETLHDGQLHERHDYAEYANARVAPEDVVQQDIQPVTVLDGDAVNTETSPAGQPLYLTSADGHSDLDGHSRPTAEAPHFNGDGIYGGLVNGQSTDGQGLDGHTSANSQPAVDTGLREAGFKGLRSEPIKLPEDNPYVRSATLAAENVEGKPLGVSRDPAKDTQQKPKKKKKLTIKDMLMLKF